VPTELAGRSAFKRRLHLRGTQPEYRFTYRHDPDPRLPILRGGGIELARWGNGLRRSRVLPRTGWAQVRSIETGLWLQTGAVEVEIPASYGLAGRGVWYAIERGIRGLLVPDEHGQAVAYPIVMPSSHYFRNMTGADWMAVLIGQEY
jgi:hypothetical protein